MNSLNKSALQSGFTSEIVTPQKPVELGGYGYYLNRISTGVLDDIYTKALYLKSSGGDLLLISNDLIGLSARFAKSLIKEISKKTKILQKNILINCTHTHSAPATAKMAGCGEINLSYLQELKNKIVKNALESVKKTKKTSIKFKNLPIGNFSFNKSFPKKEIVKQDVLLFLLESGNKKILFVQFPCHPVILNNTFTVISKDYINAFYLFAKEKNFDEIIFFNGACANILPAIVKRLSTTNSAGDSYVSKSEFNKEIEKLKNQLMTKDKKIKWNPIKIDQIKIVSKRVILEYDLPEFYKDKEKMKKYFEEIFYDQIDLDGGLIKAIPEKKNTHLISKEKRIKGIQKFIQTRLSELEKKIKENKLQTSKKIELKSVRLGKVFLIGAPLELPSRYETALKSFYPFLGVLGYTNGLDGYIYLPEESDTYVGTRGSFLYNFFPFKKESFGVLLKETKKLIKQ